jgi:hypothetical protein
MSSTVCGITSQKGRGGVSFCTPVFGGPACAQIQDCRCGFAQNAGGFQHVLGGPNATAPDILDAHFVLSGQIGKAVLRRVQQSGHIPCAQRELKRCFHFTPLIFAADFEPRFDEGIKLEATIRQEYPARGNSPDSNFTYENTCCYPTEYALLSGRMCT